MALILYDFFAQCKKFFANLQNILKISVIIDCAVDFCRLNLECVIKCCGVEGGRMAINADNAEKI